MWNYMPADIKLCKSMYTFIKNVQSFTFETISIWLMILFYYYVMINLYLLRS